MYSRIIGNIALSINYSNLFEASENGIDDKLIRTRYQQSALVSCIPRTSNVGLPSLRFQFIGDYIASAFLKQ